MRQLTHPSLARRVSVGEFFLPVALWLSRFPILRGCFSLNLLDRSRFTRVIRDDLALFRRGGRLLTAPNKKSCETEQSQ